MKTHVLALGMTLLSIAPVAWAGPGPLAQRREARAEFRGVVRQDAGLALFHARALARAVGRSLRMGGLGALAGAVPVAYGAVSARRALLPIALGGAATTYLSYVRTTRRQARTETAQHAVEAGLMSAELQQRLNELDVIELQH